MQNSYLVNFYCCTKQQWEWNPYKHNTIFDVQAYASYMKGTLLFEQDKNWETALMNFKNARYYFVATRTSSCFFCHTRYIAILMLLQYWENANFLNKLPCFNSILLFVLVPLEKSNVSQYKVFILMCYCSAFLLQFLTNGSHVWLTYGYFTGLSMKSLGNMAM